MSDDMDPGTSTIERMLHERLPQMPPPALRARVLAAVKVPATKYGKAGRRHYPDYADLVAGTFLMGTAMSLLIVATLSWAAASRPVDSATDRQMLSFVQRAEAAGITLDVAGPATTQVAGRDERDDVGVRPRDILRSIDSRAFLQGEL